MGAAWKVVRKVKHNADRLDSIDEMLHPTISHYTPLVTELISQAKSQGMNKEPHIAPVLAKLEVSLQYLKTKHGELYPENGEEIVLVTQFLRDRKGAKVHDEIMKARRELEECERTLRHFLSEKPAMLSPPPPPYRSPSPSLVAEKKVAYRSSSPAFDDEIRVAYRAVLSGTKNPRTPPFVRTSEVTLARDLNWRAAKDTRVKPISPTPLPFRKYSWNLQHIGLVLLLVVAVVVAYKAGSFVGMMILWLKMV